MDGTPLRAIVTGSAGGLGAAVAERLVTDGGRVVLLDLAEEVLRTAARLGPAARGIRADISDETSVAKAITAAVVWLGGIDLIVSNAGIGGPATTVEETDVAAFRRVLDVNLVGTFLVARAAVPVMRAGGRGGAIVNMGSLFGQQAVPALAGYCASKAGIALLTQTLALELADAGITVNTIAPGNMDAPMHEEELEFRAAERGTTVEEERARVRATIPLGRHGTGADVGGVVAWLASPDASYVTGQTIAVNGGVLRT